MDIEEEKVTPKTKHKIPIYVASKIDDLTLNFTKNEKLRPKIVPKKKPIFNSSSLKFLGDDKELEHMRKRDKQKNKELQ